MTQQDKDILIGKMIDSPSSLTEEELRTIMLDDELKDIYQISSEVSNACIRQPEIDMEQEWRLFRRRMLPKPSPAKWIMRVAAIFLGVMVASGILVRLTDYILTEEKQPIVADAERSVDKSNHNRGEDAETQTIELASEISGMKVGTERLLAAESAAIKNPRRVADNTESEEDVDVEEYLRQQRTEIDNEIALLNAEIYLDELDAISEFMGYINTGNAEEMNAEILIQ
ncbi:MAG: hypothetical protein K2L11_07480 [Muribaculaceae bacterium]|nr:hypothetical protein [Muribaculaceae bacterium]